MAKHMQIVGSRQSLQLVRGTRTWAVLDTRADVIVAVCSSNAEALERAISFAMGGK